MPTIALLGDRSAAFVTHRALDALAEQVTGRAVLEWVPTPGASPSSLEGYDGVWAVPGTPYADEDAVQRVLTHRRENGLPTLGTCGGFQHMVLEFAREVIGIREAAHGETDPGAEQIVVGALACSLVGETRTVTAVPDTRFAAICGTEPFEGFHFCSYGVDLRWRGTLVDAGLVLSAFAPDAGAEAVELPDHPFWIGTLFQPQMAALDGGAVHPLVEAFLAAAG